MTFADGSVYAQRSLVFSPADNAYEAVEAQKYEGGRLFLCCFSELWWKMETTERKMLCGEFFVRRIC